jgi:hypothetical protein
MIASIQSSNMMPMPALHMLGMIVSKTNYNEQQGISTKSGFQPINGVLGGACIYLGLSQEK